MPGHSAARVLLVSTTLVLLLLAGATAAASTGDAASSNVTATTTVTSGNSSFPTAPAGPADNNGPETYVCYLCTGRHTMLMRWCPIYWDECHLVCRDGTAAATTTAAVSDSGSGPVSAVLPGEPLGDDIGDDDECYVMKLYSGGRYAIVAIRKCGEVKTCGLTCGGGELLGAGNALPAAAVPVPAAASQRPRLADFQRCGDQAAMAWARGTVHRGA